MARKILYNNIEYDIINAIPLNNCEYLIMSNPNNLLDIKYVEKSNKDGVDHYTLPPSNFNSNNGQNPNDLLVHIIINKTLQMVKKDITESNISTIDELNTKMNRIKEFFVAKDALIDFKKLSNDDLINLLGDLKKILNLKQDNKLDYDKLCDLSVDELKEIASDKSLTSQDLIYILDALDKKLKTEEAIKAYTNAGHQKVKTKNAAFVDTVLLSLIAGSFGLLLLISLF